MKTGRREGEEKRGRTEERKEGERTRPSSMYCFPLLLEMCEKDQILCPAF